MIATFGWIFINKLTENKQQEGSMKKKQARCKKRNWKMITGYENTQQVKQRAHHKETWARQGTKPRKEAG